MSRGARSASSATPARSTPTRWCSGSTSTAASRTCPTTCATPPRTSIGFQRSFRSPLQIGYHNRTRFWEPSFWGVNATAQGRKLIDDAFALEQRSDIKATDDYFLEEAWRANAAHLTFQMLPSTAVVRRSTGSGPASREGFFVFGSSGNVAHYKDKVAQHPAQAATGSRKKALRQAKKLEQALPEAARRPMRRDGRHPGRHRRPDGRLPDRCRPGPCRHRRCDPRRGHGRRPAGIRPCPPGLRQPVHRHRRRPGHDRGRRGLPGALRPRQRADDPPGVVAQAVPRQLRGLAQPAGRRALHARPTSDCSR